jgi:hypothetical protein
VSARESIAENIVTTLKAMTTPVKAKYVTREPFDFNKLSAAQFPALLVRTTNETRGDSSIGGSIGTRMGELEYEIVGYVQAKNIDKARNQLIESIEEKMDDDRTRGGYALDTQIISVEVDEGSIDPVGGIIVTVRVMYNFTRGSV